MPYTDKQIKIIRDKEARMPDALKRDKSVNYTEGWFFVTLNTRDGVPLLSQCEGDFRIEDGYEGAPHCKYSELGERVLEVWKSIPSFHEGAIIDLFEAMPEHVHGLLYLKQGNKEHLGHLIRGFMIGCSHCYWDTLGINWKKNHPTGGAKTDIYRGVATPEFVDKSHTRSYRGPALFVHGYNDIEPITAEQVEIKRSYIRNQARKRLIQGDKHTCFIKHRQQHSRNWTLERAVKAIDNDRYFCLNKERADQAKKKISARLNVDSQGICIDYIGNRALLAARLKLPLICHRADERLFDKQKKAVINAARKGAVIVSAFISPKEREIKELLMTELLPFVEIMDNGFAERYKPVGKSFYALAENRLTQITCWNYQYQKEVIVSREMCMVMNEVVRIIARKDEGWWSRQRREV